LKIERAGFEGKMRQKSDGSLFKTDNGNYIYDIKKPQSFPNPEAAHNLLAALPGVVETGFFFNLPVQALVGYKDGNVIFRN
jgi:ribose 5-phosphate isomerase A